MSEFTNAVAEMTAEEAAELEANGIDGESDVEVEEKEQKTSLQEKFTAAISEDPVEDKSDSIPEWAIIPDGLQIPRGKKVFFMRFLAKWTDRPDMGDRVVVLWTLSVSDEKLARKRITDSNEAIPEMAKQCVRVIDGKKVDHTGMAASKKAKLGEIKAGADLNSFWNEIGPSCRQMIQNWYMNTHMLSAEDQLVFFASCIGVKNTVGT